MKELDWQVIYYDINARKIDTFNVFSHGSFASEIEKELNKSETKEEFAEKLRRSLQYYFWTKCEWEILISPWASGHADEAIKVDVYWQVMNNWQLFLDHVWSAKTYGKKQNEQRIKAGSRNDP